MQNSEQKAEKGLWAEETDGQEWVVEMDRNGQVQVLGEVAGPRVTGWRKYV